MKRKMIDLSPYFGDGVDLETGQERWDALPQRTRLRYARAILKIFAAAREEERRERLIRLAKEGAKLPEPTPEEWERSVARYRKYPLPVLMPRCGWPRDED